jgi:hypothetical protein
LAFSLSGFPDILRTTAFDSSHYLAKEYLPSFTNPRNYPLLLTCQNFNRKEGVGMWRIWKLIGEASDFSLCQMIVGIGMWKVGRIAKQLNLWQFYTGKQQI